MITAENIRSLRLAYDLTQQELASILGVARRTVKRWEQGKNVPSARALVTLDAMNKAPGEKPMELERRVSCARAERLSVVYGQASVVHSTREGRDRYFVDTRPMLTLQPGESVVNVYLRGRHVEFNTN